MVALIRGCVCSTECAYHKFYRFFEKLTTGPKMKVARTALKIGTWNVQTKTSYRRLLNVKWYQKAPNNELRNTVKTGDTVVQQVIWRKGCLDVTSDERCQTGEQRNVWDDGRYQLKRKIKTRMAR